MNIDEYITFNKNPHKMLNCMKKATQIASAMDSNARTGSEMLTLFMWSLGTSFNPMKYGQGISRETFRLDLLNYLHTLDYSKVDKQDVRFSLSHLDTWLYHDRHVGHIKHYFDTYDRQLGWDTVYTNDIYYRDFVYGIGVFLSTEFQFADGLRKFEYLMKLFIERDGFAIDGPSELTLKDVTL